MRITLFLDQEQEFNFDHKINYGIKPYINKNNYFKNLNNFLIFLKKIQNKNNYSSFPEKKCKICI